MDAIALIGLLIYTCGAFAYGMASIFWIREVGRVAWPSRPSRASGALTENDAINGALLMVSFTWFCVNAIVMFLRLGPRVNLWALDLATLFLAFSFPPLIMHTAWAEVAKARSTSGLSPSRALLWPAYIVAIGIPIFSLVIFLARPSTPLARAAGMLLGYSLPILFVCAAVYSMVLIGRKPVERRTRARQERRWLLGLFAVMGLLFVVLLVAGMQRGGIRGRPVATALLFELEIAVKSLPLLFIFVGAYFENRFDFLDVFVKRGLALLASMAAMAAGFAVMLPILRSAEDRWFAPWMYAIAMLPVIAVLPGIHRRIANVLDRRWLGRRFTAVEAITRFLTGLKSATHEAQLIELAQAGLGDIFGAPCLIELHADRRADAAPFSVQLELPIQSADAPGRILMGPRASEARYFREDIELLASLADVLASVVIALRLQEKKLEQEQRAQQLSLHASRSELKALRAQINPHFLFNALNAIAGLIHRNPRAADRTIEQLADVFRYALRGAESEWAALGDEAEFVQAYLDVERARFGDRLRAEVCIADHVRAARVPTMAVQTLVENAVKHGLSELRGPAVVRVLARHEGETLVVSVIDNGPGFSDTARAATEMPPGPRGGYGLTNVRQRLRGYFGDDGSLMIERDTSRGETIVSLRLPLLFDAARADGPTAVAHVAAHGETRR